MHEGHKWGTRSVGRGAWGVGRGAWARAARRRRSGAAGSDVTSEDVHDRDPRASASDVVLESEPLADRHLALTGLLAQLPPALGELGNAGGADGMTLGEKAARGVHGNAPVEGGLALERGRATLALLYE